MFRRTLAILSPIGLLLSVGLWGLSFVGLEYTPQRTQGGTKRAIGLGFGSVYTRAIDLGNRPPFVISIDSTWRLVMVGGPHSLWRPRYAQSWWVLPLWIPTIDFASGFVLSPPLRSLRRTRRLCWLSAMPLGGLIVTAALWNAQLQRCIPLHVNSALKDLEILDKTKFQF